MASLSESSIWSTLLQGVTKNTNAASLAQTLLKGTSKSDYSSYITILSSLYTKYKSSSNSNEVSAANLAKQVSTVISGLNTSSSVISKLGSLFGKK